MSAPAQPLRVALLGAGVVGSEVARLLMTQADDLAARSGAPLELAGIGVRRLDAERTLAVDPALLHRRSRGAGAPRRRRRRRSR